MKKAVSAGLIGIATFAGIAAAEVQVYEADPAHSRIGFGVRHMMVSTVRGQFDSYNVTIKHDTVDMTKSSVEVTIDAASINTRNDNRDEDIRSDKLLDAKKFPHLTFKSKRVEKRGDSWVAVGDLTIRDVTKEVELPFTFAGPVKSPYGQMVIGIEGGLAINRMDYGAKWNVALEAGGVLVDETVKIEIALEAKPPKSE